MCDPELREYLRDFIPPVDASIAAPRSTPPIADIVHPKDTPAADGDSFLIELGEPLPQNETRLSGLLDR